MKLNALLTSSLFLSFSACSFAVTIIDDGFETATHPTNFRTAAAGTGAAFYGSATMVGTALATDSVSGSQALSVTTGSTYQIVSPLGGVVSLANTGDYITLSFKVRFTNTTTGAAVSDSAFRFGVFNSTGTPVTGEGFGSLTTNDVGFYGVAGYGAAATTTTTVFGEDGGQGTILSGNDRSALAMSGAGFSIADAAYHTISLTLTRTSASVIQASYSLDGGAAITGNAGVTRSSFDEIAFSSGFTTPLTQYNIDDVKVDASNFTLVPEPSAPLLGGLAALSFCLRRRK